MMRYSRHNAAIQEEIQINLTPLIDVVFVVLIMFIIIAPMLELDRVQLAPGASEQTIPVGDAAPIAIYVHADNTIWLGKIQVTEKELIACLQQLRLQYAGTTPQLFHDKQAYFGTYQLVKQAIENAGFEQLDVILQP